MSYLTEPAGHGFYTFATLFKMMGSQRVLPMGAYDDYYSYGPLTSNVYTMFRGLIMDFGFIGSVAFMFGVGLVVHWAFYSLLASKRPALSVASFIFTMGFLFSSFVISMLGSNVVYYATFALLWLVLGINVLLSNSRRAPSA
jgi:oligosaccharide repeat unit polymerase